MYTHKLKLLLRILTLCVFVYFITIYPVCAQKGTRCFAIPKEYSNPTGDLLARHDKEENTGLWIVYADRTGITYQSPGSPTKMRDVEFMDAFVVVAEQSGYFHIYRCDQETRRSIMSSGKLRTLPGNAVDYGWIEITKLLLWNHCLVNPGTAIFKKALSIINDVDIVNNLGKYMRENSSLKIFNHPNCDESLINDKEIRLAQFLFVYKTDKTSLLVGIAPTFNSLDYNEKIFGWVDKTVVQEWSDRVCYEPDWRNPQADDRKEKGIKASLFYTQEDAHAFYAGDKPSEEPEWNDDSYNAKKSAYEKRFPVLKALPDGLIETGSVTQILDTKGVVQATTGEHAQVLEGVYKSVKDKIKTVNIVFVIDGDESMREYMASTVGTIRSSMVSSYDLGTSLSFNFGAVVYYSTCTDPAQSVKSVRLSSDQGSTIAFIEGVLKQPSPCGSDTTRALYGGLEEAIRLFSGADKEQQSNFIVVVGSAGDKKDDKKESFLINQMANSVSGVIVFHMFKGDDPSFDYFINELSTLTKKAAEMINKASCERDKKYCNLGIPNWDQKVERGRLNYPVESAIMGYMVKARLNKPINPTLFEKTMDSVILITQKETIEAQAELTNRTEGMGERDYPMTARFARFATKAIKGGVDSKLMSKFADENFQFFIKSYFEPKMEGLNDDVFIPVLLVSMEEYYKIKDALSQFQKGGSQDNMRTGYENAYKYMIKAFVGDVDEETMKTWDLKKASAVISGLPSESLSGILKNYKLEDLGDPKSKIDMLALEKVFNTKYKQLQEYENDENNVCKIAETRYFWLPVYLLP